LIDFQIQRLKTMMFEGAPLGAKITGRFEKQI